MGLITSTRSDDYAYRLYDEAAVKRLEQILILRKLNISIKDIQRIFNTSGSEVVLEVLGKKSTLSMKKYLSCMSLERLSSNLYGKSSRPISAKNPMSSCYMKRRRR
jgi:hypothetical protein